ncbi:MAG: hypothetical protein H6767_07885 [Candidatus Peribacteria bacterium]|nr:MAG: hypothetical protein H6767_07885 [Candidatus Peribacteria bacterium]
MGIKKGYLRILALLLFTVGNSVFAEDIEDTQVIDELNKSEAIQLDEGFELQSFGSCEDFETVMGDYMKSYWKNNQSRYYRGGPILYMEDDMVMESVADVEESADSSLQSKAV